MLKFFRNIRANEEGATAIEYGLIAALVAIALIAGLNAIGGSLNTLFTNVSTSVSDASPAQGGGTDTGTGTGTTD